jgi:hypothetical protein
VVISDAARRKASTGLPSTDGPTVTVGVTGLPANGPYTVAFRVVSTDGHTVQGSYTFTLADPAQPPPATVAPAVTGPDADGGSPVAMVEAAVAVAVVGALASALTYRRRRRGGDGLPSTTAAVDGSPHRTTGPGPHRPA